MAIVTEKKIEITITEGQGKERIDSYLANHIEFTSRSKIQKLIKA
ncbi:MAG: RluA family pseudouridine synthase, partial [Ignavibacteriae bacterium]|nr:RluA family pseudouridine synthase [Ignavibacteriota bacterium]